MTPKDLLYQHVFKDLMSKNLSQKQAGDHASRACYLWAHGRSHDVAIKVVMNEAKHQIKAAKKAVK